MARYEHKGGAASTTLTGTIDSDDMSFSVADGTGYPTGSVGSFWIVIDPGTATEEKVLCSSRATNAFTVASGGRGADDTTATAHQIGAVVRHVFTATEADQANAHIESTTGHGATGAVVGTTNEQTLTNKTISGASNTFSNIPQAAVVDLVSDLGDIDTALEGLDSDIEDVANDLSSHASDVTTHGVTSGAIVGTANTQTLTNKTMSGSSNSFSNIPLSSVSGLTTFMGPVDRIGGGSVSSLTVNSDGNGSINHGLGWTPEGALIIHTGNEDSDMAVFLIRSLSSTQINFHARRLATNTPWGTTFTRLYWWAWQF